MKQILRTLRFIAGHPLSGKHKIRAISNWVAWQFTQSISPRLVVRPFVGNTKIWAMKGMEAATANLYTGLHEFNEMGFLLHFLRSSDTFIDLGSNIGSYTILASGVIGARSICIEPVPETFSIVRKNLLLNHIEEKVKPLNIGVGSEEGILYFTTNKGSGNHVVFEKFANNEKTVEVQIKTLDQILEKEDCPSLIKIDVEGFERQVIDGGEKTLSNHKLKAIIIELNGSGKFFGIDEESIHKDLLKKDFLPFTYHPFNRKLEQLTTYGSNNTIYIRDFSFVEDRILGAGVVEVFSESF